MDIIPQRNLPDPSQPWGRHIEKLATGNADDITKTNQRVTITNQNTASTISALQDQISALTTTQNAILAQQAYLANLQTYTAVGTSNITWTTNIGAWSADSSTAVTFTLATASTVVVTYVFPVIITFGGTGSGIFASIACYVDGVLTGNSSAPLIEFQIGVSPSVSAGASLSGTFNRVISLAAGAHTISGALNPGAFAGSPSATSSNRSMTVQVVSSP